MKNKCVISLQLRGFVIYYMCYKSLFDMMYNIISNSLILHLQVCACLKAHALIIIPCKCE